MQWNVDGQWNSELAKFANYRGVDGKPRKLNDTDVTSRLRELVLSYLSSYQGTNEFLASLRKQANWLRLTKKQVAGAANWIINEYRTQLAQAKADASAFDKRHNTGSGSSYSDFVGPLQPAAPSVADQEFIIDFSMVAKPSRKAVEPLKPATPTVTTSGNVAPVLAAAIALDATRPALPDGTYTVTLPSGEFRTLRLALAPNKLQDRSGTRQIVSYLSGPNNERDYIGFAFVNGRSATVWKQYAGKVSVTFALLQFLLGADDPFMYGEQYAMQSGKCFICGRKLTVPASLHSGMGPTCAAKNGR